MIFVTVGSQKFPFLRLVRKVDQMAGTGLTEEVVIQTGTADYTPVNCRYRAFYDRDAYEEMIDRCSILITHGGTGTVVDAVKRGKKTIVVPRRAVYGEHVDDHQLQLSEQFHRMNLVYACPDTESLPQALQAVRDRDFSIWQPNTARFLAAVSSGIRSLMISDSGPRGHRGRQEQSSKSRDQSGTEMRNEGWR